MHEVRRLEANNTNLSIPFGQPYIVLRYGEVKTTVHVSVMCFDQNPKHEIARATSHILFSLANVES